MRSSSTWAAASLIVFVVVSIKSASCFDKPEGRVVYGEDNRQDEYLTDSSLRTYGSATAALISKSKVKYSNNKYRITDTTTLQQYGVCKDQRFSEQIIPAYCSGFLISPRLLATAGHCIQSVDDCKNTYIIFGFAKTTESSVTTEFASNMVYTCATYKTVYDGYVDFSIITLDRDVTDIKPLTLDSSSPKKAGVYVVGHPTGLPRKYAGGANILYTYSDFADLRWFFIADLDTFGGNSGSGVFYSGSNKVAGILVRGATDYIWKEQKGCADVNVCTRANIYNQNCGGEHVTVSEAIVPYVPLKCTVDSDCKNKGLCQSGTCQCQPGYYGNDCSFKCGRDKCYDHGECVGLWECKCDAGYGGDLCYSTSTKSASVRPQPWFALLFALLLILCVVRG